MGLTKNYIVNYDIQARVDSAINNIGRLRTAVEQLYGFDQKTKVFRGFTALNKSISDIESKLVRLNELSKTITPTVSIDLVKFDRQLQLMQRSVQGAAAKMRQAIQSALVGSNDDFMKAQRGLSGSSVAKAAQSMMAQYMKGYDAQIAAIERGIAAHEQTIKNLSTSSARVLKAGVTGEDLKKLKKEADERARKANEDEIKREVRRQKLAKKDLENKVSERAAVQKAFREVMGYSPLIDEVNRPEILPSIKTMREMQKKISASLAAPYSATDPFFEKSKKSRDKILKNQQSQLNTWKTAQREWIMSARYGVQTISEMNRNVPMENLKVLADSLMGKEFSARVRLVPDLSMVDELLKKPFDARVNVRPVNIEKLKTDIEAIKPVIKADVVTEDKKKGKGGGTKAKGKTTETVVTEAAKKGAALTQSKTAKVMETFGTFITNITSKPIDINVSLIPDIAALKAKLAEAKVDVPASLKINTEMLAKNLAKMKPVTIPVIAQEKPGAKGKAKTKAVETVNANLNFTPNIEGVKEALKLASLTANVALNGDIPALDKKIKAYKFSANVSLTPLMGDIEKALGKIAVPATTPTKGKTPATKQPAKQATAKPMSFPKLTVAEEELMNKLFATFPKLSKDQETAGKRMVAAQNKMQQSSTEANLAALKNAEDKYGIARKKYTEAFNKLRPLMVKQFQSTAARLLTDEEALKGYEAQNLVSTLSAKKTLTKAQKQQLDEANKTLTALRAPEKVKAPTATKPVTVTAKTDDLKKTVAAANLSSSVKLTADIKALKEKVAATKLSAKVELTPDTKALKEKVAVVKLSSKVSILPLLDELKSKVAGYKSLKANVGLNGDIKGLRVQVKEAKLTASVTLTPNMGAIEQKLASLTANVALNAQQTASQNTTTIIPAPTGGNTGLNNQTITTTTTMADGTKKNTIKESKSKLPPTTTYGARYAKDVEYQKQRFSLLNAQNALAASLRGKAQEYISRFGFDKIQSEALVPLRKYISKAATITGVSVNQGPLNSMQQFQVVDQARRLMLANKNVVVPPMFEQVHGRLMGEAAAMVAAAKKPAPVIPTSPKSPQTSFGAKNATNTAYQNERLALLKSQSETVQTLKSVSSEYIKRLGFTQGEANSLVPYRKFINKAVEMTGLDMKKTGMTDDSKFRILDQARLLMKASGVAVPKIIDQKFNDIFAKNRNIGTAERERTRVNRADQMQRLQARGYNFMSQFTNSPTEAQALLKYRHYFTRGADLAGVTPSANLSQRHLLELLQGTKMVMEDKGVAIPPVITRRIADIEKAMQARTRENRVAKAQRLRNDYISKLSSWTSSRAEQNELLQYRHYFDRALKAYGMNHPSQLRFSTTGTQFNVMLETKNLMARKGIEFPIAMRKRMDSLYDKMHAESLKEQEKLLAQRKAENTAAHMKRFNRSYANAILGASQYAPTFKEQAELIKYRKFFRQASKELGFSAQNMPKTMEDQLKVMQNAQQRMANSGIVSSILNNRINDTMRRIAADDERAARANSRMVPLPIRSKKSFYDRLRGWSYPFTGNTSFGARTPVAYDMMKGMGMMYGVGGAMGVISEAFSNSVEYQNTMETAKAILQRNYNGNNFKSDYGKMVRTVRDVAMKTKFTAPEAADAARFMAMAGLDIPMIKASIAPIADLAVIGDNDLGFIADKMTNIQTAFGIAPQQMRKVADMMTSTITSTNTDIAMLAESMEYAAPMARMANWKKGASGSLAEALAIIGVMGNSGIQASMAGTTLRMMYQNIMKTTKDQRKAWQSLGISLKEEDGSPRNMISLLDELANKIDITSNKGKAKLPGLMSQLFRVTAGPGAAAIVQNIDKVKALAAQNMAATGNSQAISKVKQSDIKGLWAQVTSAFTEGVLKVFESAETQKYINEKLKGAIKFLQSPEFVKMMKDIGQIIKDVMVPMFKAIKTWVWLFQNFGGIVSKILVAQATLTQIGYLLVPFNQLIGVASKLGGLITGVGKSFMWLFNILKAGKAVQTASAVTNAAATATSGVAGAAGAAVAGAARGAAAGATSAAAGAAGSAAATAATMTMWQKMRAPISKFFKVIFSPFTIVGSAMFGWMKKMFAPFGNIAHQFRLFNRWGMMNNVEFYGKRGLGGFMKVTGAAGASLIRGIGAVVTRLGVIGLAVGAIYGIGKMIYNTYEQRRKTNEAIAAKQKQLSTYGNVIANNALVYNEKTGAAGRNLMQRWSPVAQGVQMNPQIPMPTRSVMSNVGANLASRKKTPLNQIKQFKPLFTNWDDNYNRLIAPTELAKQYEVYYKGNLAIMNGKDKSMTFDAMVRAANNIQRYDGEKRADYVRRKNDAIRNMIAKGAVYHFGANSMEVQAALNQINELFKAAGEDKEKIEKAKEQANKIAEQFNPQNKYIKNNTKNAKSYVEIGRSGDLSEYREWWTGAYNTLKNAIGGSNDLFAYYNSMFNLVDNKYALGNIDNLINSTILRIPNVNGQMQSLMLKIQNGSPVWTDFYDQCRKLNITFNNGVLEHCNILDGIMKTLVKMPELQPFIAEIQRVIERMKKESVKYDKLLHPFAKQYGVEDGTLVDQGYGIDSWVKNGSPYEKPGKTQIPFAPNDEVPKQKVPDKKPISILKPEDEGNNNDLPKPMWARKASMTFGGNDGATIPAQSLGQGKPMVNLNINFGDIRVEGGADQYQIAAQIESYLITALSTLKDKIGAAVVEPGNMQGSGFTTAMM